MNSSDFRVTALLTEHLGFAPLTLVDEVINAVNKIMYNCTDALETFLKKRRDAQLDTLRRSLGIGDADALMVDQIRAAEESGKVYPLTEIHHGTAELETLLVSHVDKNFDKFELYTLRNILMMPRDLVEGGWIRLKHHEHLDGIDTAHVSGDVDDRIRSLLSDVELELRLRKILRLQLSHAKKLVTLLARYKHSVDSFILANLESELSPETVRIMKENLTPVNENVYYLLSQLKDLINQVLRLNRVLVEDSVLSGDGETQFRLTNREVYLRKKTVKLLHDIEAKSASTRPG